MISQQSFKKKLASTLKALFPWRVFSLPVAAFLIFCIQDFRIAIDAYLVLLESPLAWLVWIFGTLADAVLNAVYWYYRERQPSYIKKQEAYEKWKAEKDAAKKAKNSSL